MENNILNKEEKKEIVNDVKAAFAKAQKSSNIKYNKVESKQNKSLAFITIAIILIISSLGIYWYLANNPKTIFIRSIDTFFETINSNVKSPNYDLEEGTINITYNLKPETKYQNLNNQNLKINFAIDEVNQITKTTFNINNQTFKTYKEDENKYLTLDEYPYIFFQIESPLNYNDKNIKALTNSLKETFSAIIEGQKLSGSNENILVNDKITKVYKASLVIDKENINSILDSLNANLKENTRFINSYAKVFNIKKENVNNEIDNYITNYKQKAQNFDTITINIYTKGLERDFVKAEFIETFSDNQNTYSITKFTKNKYSYLLDNKQINKKYEGIITRKEDENKTNYNLSLRKTQNNTVTLDSNFKIKITEKQITAIEKENIKDPVDKIEDEVKLIIDSKTNPLKELINIIKQ